MGKKYQNKYRIESTRLQSWDYSADAAYFITICTKGREHYFGEIQASNRIKLSEIGQHVNKCWSDIPIHFPYVILDAFIIMPDHIHGIIIINKQNVIDATVGTQHFVSLLHKSTKSVQHKNQFGPQSQNLASIIRGFKIGITKYAKMNKIDFCWQSRYHDHIIRNDLELDRIRNYINANPLNWRNEVCQ
jgi:putative transposase